MKRPTNKIKRLGAIVVFAGVPTLTCGVAMRSAQSEGAQVVWSLGVAMLLVGLVAFVVGRLRD